MKALLTVIMAGVLLGGVFADRAEAGDRGHGKRGRVNARYYRDGGNYRGGTSYRGGYFRPRDVVVIRDYYRPRTTVRCPTRIATIAAAICRPDGEPVSSPVPVYLEPQFVPVPYGYSRGFIDGHAVVYNKSGFILDIAAVF